MANDFEQLLKDVFGGTGEQLKRLQTKMSDMVRETVKDDLTKLQTEVAELRNRVAVLEAERAQKAADSLESF